MREYTITEDQALQRLDKYLRRLLPDATNGFLYRMLRKKNIVLNDQKAGGSEILAVNDQVKLFISDETLSSFMQADEELQNEYEELKELPMKGLSIIFEDDDILVADKPWNMLSQKAKFHDVSANERLLGYLIRSGAVSPESLRFFRPSVCNRLDRNTTGLILMGKTLGGAQRLAGELKKRTIEKIYLAAVAGRVEACGRLSGYLMKDEVRNQVKVLETERPGSFYIETYYEPVAFGEDFTILEVQLITGKTHQIRAHLASVGHPLIGDRKYGLKDVNDRYYEEHEIKRQLLHAYRVSFADGRTFCAELPADFARVVALKI